MRPLASLVALLAAGACRPAAPPPPEPDAGAPPCAGATFATYAPSQGASCGARAATDVAPTRRCPGFTLELSAREPSVLRLRALPDGAFPADRSFAVVSGGTAPLESGRTCDGVVVCTSELFVSVRDSDCAVRVQRADGTLLYQGSGLGDERRLAADERIYGFGERTGQLDRRGRVLIGWNTDAYDSSLGGFRPDADPLYLSIPFWISLTAGRAHGVLIDNAFRTRFEVGPLLKVTAADGAIDQYVIDGPALGRVLERYTALTGRPPLPPQWALGYHQSRWGYSPQARVLDVATELRRRRLPADAMWLDIQHMRGFRSFTFDPVTFGDPAGLTRSLAAAGFHTVAIVDPGIKVDPGWDVYDTGVRDGHFLSPFTGEVWPGPAVFPDFSSAAVRGWWAQSLVPRLTAVGVNGVWLDMNEPSNFTGELPLALPAAGDGVATTFAELHNVYALTEARATRAGLQAQAPAQRPFILSRSGFAGIQRYAAVWTGDAPSTWASLAQTPAMLLGLGLSGVPWVGSDVGGYSGGATPELFARWMQVGSISPFFRGHVTQNVNDQEPWAFGEEVEDISREVMEARYELLPYWYSLADEAARTGAPPLRPLVWEFQADADAALVSDEVMLGPWLLYAPVLAQGAAVRQVWLPPGRWFEPRSGASLTGGSQQVKLTLAALPAFVREGAIIPRRPAQQHTAERPFDTLWLEVWPSDTATGFVLYDDAGDGYGPSARTPYRSEPTASGFKLTASAREGAFAVSRRLSVRFRRVDSKPAAVRLDGASVAEGADWFWDPNDRTLRVELADRAPFELEVEGPRALLPAPTVRRMFRVRVPASTPAGTVHLASSANGWQHAPMTLVSPGVAELELEVPRGEWVFYKFTRGAWDSVEVWPGCTEAANRYAFGQAGPAKENQVFAWRDRCP